MNDEEPAVADWRVAFEERQKKLDRLREIFDESEAELKRLIDEL